MPETPKRGYISCLEFNNGETVEIRENDIVLFVGPNNAGKSQSLKDIYRWFADSGLVTDVEE